MKKDDFIAGVIFIIISVILFRQTYDFPQSPVQGAGPEFWPRLILGILILLSIILMVGAFKKQIISAVANVEIEETKKGNKLDILRPLIGIIVTIVFVLVFRSIGFVVSTFLFFVGMASLVQEKWDKIAIRNMVIQAVILITIVYFVFGRFLRVNLPQGIFFI